MFDFCCLQAKHTDEEYDDVDDEDAGYEDSDDGDVVDDDHSC